MPVIRNDDDCHTLTQHRFEYLGKPARGNRIVAGLQIENRGVTRFTRERPPKFGLALENCAAGLVQQVEPLCERRLRVTPPR